MKNILPKLNDDLTRRSLIQGVAGLSLGVSCSINNAFSKVKDESKPSTRKKVVRLFLGGGLSQLDSFDPKPNAPEVMGSTKTLKTKTGQTFSEYFPKLAKLDDKFALVRSMVSPEADHARAMYIMDTSYQVLGTVKHPSFGAWMQKLNGTANENLPSSVTIRGKASSGFLGSKYSPFKVNRAEDPLRGLVMEEPNSEENYELLRLMAKVRTNFHKNYRVEHVESYRQFYNDSIRLMQSKDLEAFDLKLEDSRSRAKYNIPHGDSFLLARRLIEADIQYVDININGWDNHFGLWENENFPRKAKEIDDVVSVFLEDFYERGLHKNTVFSINSEFGRTPKINSELGRDHHRKAFCGIIAGSGVYNGTVYGESDEHSNGVVKDPVSPMDFNATLAHLAGIDIGKEVYSSDNRPFTIARGGKIIRGVVS